MTIKAQTDSGEVSIGATELEALRKYQRPVEQFSQAAQQAQIALNTYLEYLVGLYGIDVSKYRFDAQTGTFTPLDEAKEEKT